MSSNIWVKNGIYDPTKRFAFTNIDTENFTFHWNKKPITVKAGETVELPHYLAVLATTELVDKLMLAEADKKTKEIQKSNPGYKAPNQAGSLGVPAARAVWENRILKELPPRDDNDAQLQVIRAQVTEELRKDLENGQKKANPIAAVSEVGGTKDVFEGINMPSNNGATPVI